MNSTNSTKFKRFLKNHAFSHGVTNITPGTYRKPLIGKKIRETSSTILLVFMLLVVLCANAGISTEALAWMAIPIIIGFWGALLGQILVIWEV